ncbi:MAG: selenium metabolism-associated LysR family transcriptional regulator [Pseudomonadota bacterium]
MLDYRRLEAFCKVYELRSFSRAGEELFLSQPTISAHVLSLERTLGVTLFDRMGRTVVPTVAGEVLYSHGMRAFATLDTAVSELAALRDDVSGQLVLGGSTIPANYILPEVMGLYLQHFPAVSPSLEVADTAKIIELVGEGSISLGVVGATEALADLHFEPIYTDNFAVVVAPSTVERLGIPAQMTAEKVLTLPWVMREMGSGTRSTFFEALTASTKSEIDTRKINTVLTVGTTEAVLRYVLAGLGVGVVSRLAAQAMLSSGALQEITVENFTATRPFYMVYNEKRVFFPAVAKFIEALRSWAASHKS